MLNSVVAICLSATVALSPSQPWPRHAIDNTSQGADGAKLADINGDGLPDIVTGWEEGGEVRVYINPGPAGAKQAWPRVTVGKVKSPEDAIFFDFNADGRPDVLSCTEGKSRSLFFHQSPQPPADLLDAAKWSTIPIPCARGSQMWMQAVVMDLDGANGADVLLGSKGPGATVGWLQAPSSPADPAAWSHHTLRLAGWIMSLLPMDMDKDGLMDAVFSDRKGERRGLFWLQNPGPDSNLAHKPWNEHPIGALNEEVMFADLGDLDGDGLMDAVAAIKPRHIAVCRRMDSAAWQESRLELPGDLGTAKAAKIADINLDGLADLVFTCEEAKGPSQGIVWLEQQASGPWLQHDLGGPEGLKYDLIVTLDLDADGDLDVITCEERDQLGVIWYENPARK